MLCYQDNHINDENEYFKINLLCLFLLTMSYWVIYWGNSTDSTESI
jgi:hypothetical protein